MNLLVTFRHMPFRFCEIVKFYLAVVVCFASCSRRGFNNTIMDLAQSRDLFQRWDMHLGFETTMKRAE